MVADQCEWKPGVKGDDHAKRDRKLDSHTEKQLKANRHSSEHGSALTGEMACVVQDSDLEKCLKGYVKKDFCNKRYFRLFLK